MERVKGVSWSKVFQQDVADKIGSIPRIKYKWGHIRGGETLVLRIDFLQHKTREQQTPDEIVTWGCKTFTQTY